MGKVASKEPSTDTNTDAINFSVGGNKLQKSQSQQKSQSDWKPSTTEKVLIERQTNQYKEVVANPTGLNSNSSKNAQFTSAKNTNGLEQQTTLSKEDSAKAKSVPKALF